MPGGCAAVGCSNRGDRGFIMVRFPRDPARRKQWLTNVKRAEFTPNDNTVLCEIHFESDMWEKHRADGKRKLKPNAVPTIFPCMNDKSKRKSSKKKISVPMEKFSIVLDSSAASTFSNINPVVLLPDPSTSTSELNTTSTSNFESSGSTSITFSKDAHYEDLKQQNIRLRNQNETLKLRNRDLENNSRKLKFQLLVFSSKLKKLMKKRKKINI